MSGPYILQTLFLAALPAKVDLACCVQPCLETARQNSSPTACLRGDRFTDFVAREYEFPVSIPGESYSIFTEADHQVNALLQPAAGATEIGLMFRGVGVHGPDTSIKVSLGEDSSFAGECCQHWFDQTLPQTHLSLVNVSDFVFAMCLQWR